MASPVDPNSLTPLKRALLALDDMKARLDAAERARSEPIAVVGIGCRFPAGVHGAEAFWRFLRDGGDAITEVPRQRWDADAYFDPDPAVPGKSYGKWGAFLDDVDRFDPQFFGIAPREAAGIDPQQRLLLETSWEALEHAGSSPEILSGTPAGVFVGINSIDYAAMQLQNCDLARVDAYSLSGSAHSIAAGRLAYVLGLQGPAMAVDTACSSSLVAVHLACQSLRNDDCRFALAAGVHIALTPINSVVFSKLRMLAADGRCKTFDARGDGFVEGEGCAVLALKRLSDAIADGDRVIALIRGTAVNQDGASSGLTAPNGPAQESVIRAALKRGGVKPADVDYIEAHGTGTSLGDPIEVQALAAVLGEGRAQDRPVAIGSVKTNIGHTQAAAGIAGLVKLILAIQHREIPPTLHFEQPNPHIPWSRLPVSVVTSLRPWTKESGPRVGGVSSFGFSGTNAHILVSEAPAQPAAESSVDRPLHLVTLSARTDAALTRAAARWRDDLASSGDDIRDVAFTANAGRAHLPERLALIAASRDELTAQLDAIAQGSVPARARKMHVPSVDRPKIAFLFTGQGAQYAGMGRELYDTQPAFRKALDRCAELLAGKLERPLLDVLHGAEDGALNQTAYTQPALFAIEYALAEMWRSWGIKPDAVLGHSIGEYAAAVSAGVLSLEDALALVAARGRLMQSLPAGGAMAAVFADEAAVRGAIAAVDPSVSIAAVNGPADVVVSGSDPAVAAVLATLAARGIAAERLNVSHAFHSALMEPILDEFERAASSVACKPPRITLISNVTGQAFRGEAPAPAYWRRHLREAVRFADGMNALYAAGYRLFVEVGPRPTLSGLARKFSGADAIFLPSLRKAGADWIRILETLAELYVQGAEIDWRGFDADYPRRKIALSSYPFERERHWLAGISADARPAAARGRETGHPLLGTRVSSALPQAQFDVEIDVDRPAYLADHRKRGSAVFPATAYLEMGLSAARDVLGAGAHVFDELVIGEPLVLEDRPVRVQTIVAREEQGAASFKLFSLDPASEGDRESWRLHGSGTLRAAQPADEVAAEPLSALRGRCTAAVDVAEYYEGMLANGHEYGPAFRGITAMYRGEWEAIASIALPDPIAAEAVSYRIHPALLDASMQPLAAAVPDDLKDASKGETFLPVSLGRVRVYADGARAGWTHVRVRRPSDGEMDGFAADIRLYSDAGSLVATIEDVYHKRIAADALEAAERKTMASLLYDIDWRDAPALEGASADSAACLVIGSGAPEIAAAFTAANVPVIVATPEAPDDYARALEHARGALPRPLTHVVHASAAASRDPRDIDVIADEVRAGCESLLLLTQALAAGDDQARPRLVVVTRGAAPVAAAGSDVRVTHSPVWALARTIAVEQQELRCRAIDLDPNGDVPGDAVVREVLSGDAEAQVAFRLGGRFVPRLVRSSAAQAVASNQRAEDQPVSLEIGERGVLDRLELRPIERRAPGDGEIEVRVAISGLNFRDVLNALGMYEGPPGPLGTECVGTVVRAGAGVTHVKEGDVVLGMAAASFKTFVTAPAGAFVRKPEFLTIDEAATIPVAFLTAHYALERLARLRAGERVLIHAAAGGVGLAAVQIARRAGAEIFATAGSDEKHQYLRALGVRHIMSSRTADFERAVLAATGGEGVDVVLNSLTGEFITKSVAVLRKGGRFVEIGKAGIWSEERMREARPDARYFPIYFTPDDHPLMQEMFAHLLAAIGDGSLQPLRHRVFPIAQAGDAFRFMAQAKHIGKVLVKLADAPPPAAAIRADATYLVTGGLGALGLTVARWLVEEGAKHLLLVGRSSPSTTTVAVLDDLRRLGAEVVVEQADISRREDVRRLFDSGSMPAVRGIVHTAGVNDDAVLSQQTWDRFDRVLAPKMRGTWNLHEAVEGRELDFFVCFSSMVSLFGGPGQANYAAANGFLDGFARYRRSRGLPALAINWGPWAGEGMAGRVSERDRQRWRAEGYGMIPPSRGAATLGALLRHAGAGIAAVPVDWPVLLRGFAPGTEPPILRDLSAAYAKRPAAAKDSGRRRLADLLASVPSNRKRAAIAEFLRTEALKVLGLDAAAALDERQPLSELGLDSLMAVELRNAIAAAMERTLPATLLFKHPTLEGLTQFVSSELGADAATAPELDADARSVAAMSDDEAKALLAAELESLTDLAAEET